MLDTLSKPQVERLRYIDYRVQFFGSVGRTEIQRRFDVKGAAATRDIKLYREIFPERIDYDSKKRLYFRAKGCPDISDVEYHELMTNLALDAPPSIGNLSGTAAFCEELSQEHQPNTSVFAALSRGINAKKLQNIKYISLSSGISERVIAPLALINNGIRWHLRAFDKKNNRFIDFVVNRIVSVTPTEDAIPEALSLSHDKQWNRFVTLELVPHPKLAHPEAIILEYKMRDGKYITDVRAALVGYFLRFWNVDASRDHSLKAPDSYLWLSNTATLYDVENLAIAPGYQPD